jgi:hypothetical protein
MRKQVRLRSLGQFSFGFTLPMELVTAFGLTVGDTAILETEGDVVSLRFLKVTKVETPASIQRDIEAETAA